MFYQANTKTVKLRGGLHVKTTITVLDKKGGNATSKVIEALDAVNLKNSATFGIITPSTVALKKDLKGLSVKNLDSTVTVGFASSKSALDEKSEMVRLEDATIVFDGRIYSATWKKPIAAIMTEKKQGDYSRFAETFLNKREGDYSLTIAQDGKIVAARDPIGVQPLYYGESETVAALASNRRTLWKLGIEEPQSFPPGHVAVVTREGFKFSPVKTLPYQAAKPVTLQEAAETLQSLLESSVKKRISGVKKVAVAFSGGLDSSVIAFLAEKCEVEVQLMHVSLENQPETEEAWKTAEELQLPMQVHLFKESDIEKAISIVVGLIEEPDPVKASVGVPFYWTAEKTAEAGFKVLLAGQGADELFGGYQRYVTEYMLGGDDKVRQTMFHDVVNIHESNIERDEKICIFHDVELRLPFASYQIAEFAMSLPTELKFERKADSLRKLVLRRAAENMGLSKAIAEKPKKAVQYSTGISSALKKLAKKQNLTVAEYINRIFTEIKNNAEKP
jgi:asparagine synthase (glutamine-hydrolysing)